jgi:hypothetical protein
MRVILASLVLAVLALPAIAAAAAPPATWPPRAGDGILLAHYGEEHWNDSDGGVLLPKVVTDVVRYRPDLVTMSGDKANNGTEGELRPWLEIMGAYDRAGIPWFAGVGNHDRDLGLGEQAAAELGGVTPAGSLEPYKAVFKDRPYPMGDALPYADERFGPRTRPTDDPDGAASHFYVDAPGVRVIYIDNSCQSITNCEPLQNPPDGAGLTQYDYLSKHAGEAKAAGKLVFVVMHQPTQDPGDQSYRKATARMHVMAKGATPDNAQFEQVAAAAKVDGVFLAHIKGQFQYVGQGKIPYFIDGGAGGALYTDGPVGTDHGYWHGYRLMRVLGNGKWETDAVPIFTPGSLKVTGPDRVLPGESVTYAGFGAQPVKNHTAKVDALELRDPDPTPKAALSGTLGSVLRWFGPLLAILFVASAVAAGSAAARRSRMPRVARRGLAASLAAAAGLASIAAAQQSEPTSTPKEALPNPARIWTSADPRVLAPVASSTDDARRNPATQTADGRFKGVCPGRTKLWLTSGWETRAADVRVASAPGAVARSIRPQSRRLRRGRRAKVVTVDLAQAAITEVRVKRGNKVVKTLFSGCTPKGKRALSWKPTRRGRYAVQTVVRSDRPTVSRRFTVTVR